MRPEEAAACEPELLIMSKRMSSLIERVDHVGNRLESKVNYLFGTNAESVPGKPGGQVKGKQPGAIGDLKDSLDTLESMMLKVQTLLGKLEQA